MSEARLPTHGNIGRRGYTNTARPLWPNPKHYRGELESQMVRLVNSAQDSTQAFSARTLSFDRDTFTIELTAPGIVKIRRVN